MHDVLSVELQHLNWINPMSVVCAVSGGIAVPNLDVRHFTDAILLAAVHEHGRFDRRHENPFNTPHVANVGGKLGLKRYHAPRRIQRGRVQSWRITIALYAFSLAFFFYTFVLAIQYWLSGDIEEDFDKYYTLYIIISSSAMIILAIAAVVWFAIHFTVTREGLFRPRTRRI